MSQMLLLCAACMASHPTDDAAAFGSEWSTTIYRGNALCMKHFREQRIAEQDKALAAQLNK
jgi:hypothetical protein